MWPACAADVVTGFFQTASVVSGTGGCAVCRVANAAAPTATAHRLATPRPPALPALAANRGSSPPGCAPRPAPADRARRNWSKSTARCCRRSGGKCARNSRRTPAGCRPSAPPWGCARVKTLCRSVVPPPAHQNPRHARHRVQWVARPHRSVRCAQSRPDARRNG